MWRGIAIWSKAQCSAQHTQHCHPKRNNNPSNIFRAQALLFVQAVWHTALEITLFSYIKSQFPPPPPLQFSLPTPLSAYSAPAFMPSNFAVTSCVSREGL